MKVLVTGGKGQLAQAVTELFTIKDFQVFALGREELDVTSLDKCQRIVSLLEPDLIIHCAAMTKVDDCENNPDQAFKVNAIGSKNMALVSKDNKAKLIYISTNFVFSGETDRPYQEDEPAAPLNIYGQSKLKGEAYIQAILANYFIIRTSWLYGQGSHNFVIRMIQLAQKQGNLAVVDDQFATPTLVNDLTVAILQLLKRGAAGIYHITNDGYCSRYQWVERIVKQMGLPVKLTKVDSSYFAGAAPRPKFAVLDCHRYHQVTGVNLRNWQNALDYYLTITEEKYT